MEQYQKLLEHLEHYCIINDLADLSQHTANFYVSSPRSLDVLRVKQLTVCDQKSINAWQAAAYLVMRG